MSVDLGILPSLRRNLKTADEFFGMFMERVVGGLFVETDLGLEKRNW